MLHPMIVSYIHFSFSLYTVVVLMVIPFCVVLKQEREYNRPHTRYGIYQIRYEATS